MAANQRPRNPQGNRPPQGGSRQVSAKRRKNSKGKIILFAVEIVIILIMHCSAWMPPQTASCSRAAAVTVP